MKEQHFYYNVAFRCKLVFFGGLVLAVLVLWATYGITFVQPGSEEVFGTRAPIAGMLMLLFAVVVTYMMSRMIVRGFLSVVEVTEKGVTYTHIGGYQQHLAWDEVIEIEKIEPNTFRWTPLQILAAITGFYKRGFEGVRLSSEKYSLEISSAELSVTNEALEATLSSFASSRDTSYTHSQ